MEHIIQFGVTIDEDAIKRKVEDRCTEEVKKKMMKCFFDSYGMPSADTEVIIREWLEGHKDEIISKAAEVIAEKMYKSNRVRQSIIEKCGEEVND